MTDTTTARSVTMTGTQIEHALTDAARKLGYLCFHANEAKRSEPGFPDLIIVGHDRLFVFECKSRYEKLRDRTVTRKGRALPGQSDWLTAFAGATPIDDDWEQSCTVAIVRPSIAGEPTKDNDVWTLGYDHALQLLQVWAEQSVQQRMEATT